ncbi:hypothetical protein [Azospira oryzae]|uniref:hypothetical protein n=1 Tax=Azospira oryzae TaxID=146939 RepID=UPI001966B751|nr:hypothetical protein [Azospira oryzae]
MRREKGDPVYVRLRRENEAEIRRFAKEYDIPVSDAIDIAVASFVRDERLVNQIADLLERSARTV